MGRIAFNELLIFDSDIEQQIAKGISTSELKQYTATQKGMITLFMDALEKVKFGITSIDEIERLIGIENPISYKKEKIEKRNEDGYEYVEIDFDEKSPKEEMEIERFENPLLKEMGKESEIKQITVKGSSSTENVPLEEMEKKKKEQPIPLERTQEPKSLQGQTYVIVGDRKDDMSPDLSDYSMEKSPDTKKTPIFEKAICPNRNLVLIIDDDRLNRKMVKALLESENLTVIEAENGIIGIEMVHRHRPGLVIMESQLPNMKYNEILKALRINIEFTDIQVLILTSSSDKKEELNALEFGADDYVRKPFEPSLLMARIKAIKRRQAISIAE